MSDLHDRILKYLEKSGFPTEIRASEIILSRNQLSFSVYIPYWFVTNQRQYFDEENNNVNSVDIYANRYVYTQEEDRRIQKICKLYIECKKSDKTKWIFYPRYRDIGLIDRSLPDAEMELRRDFTTKLYLRKENHPFNDIPNSYNTFRMNIGIAHQNVFSERDDFYKAQNQVLKALFYSERNNMSPKPRMTIPIIIYEGGLFTYLIKDGTPTVNPIPYIRYISQGIVESPIPVYIDIIDIEHFNEYLGLIEYEFLQWET